jgi:cysteine desulfurase
MGVSAAEAVGHLRLTLGRSTTAADIEEVLRVLPPLVQRLRRLQV